MLKGRAPRAGLYQEFRRVCSKRGPAPSMLRGMSQVRACPNDFARPVPRAACPKNFAGHVPKLPQKASKGLAPKRACPKHIKGACSKSGLVPNTYVRNLKGLPPPLPPSLHASFSAGISMESKNGVPKNVSARNGSEAIRKRSRNGSAKKRHDLRAAARAAVEIMEKML